MVMRVTKKRAGSRLLACDPQSPQAICGINDIQRPKTAA
jgi:hypothetical protein